MPYPNMLARGLTAEGEFKPFELFAGESDIVTSQGKASAPVRQFALVKRTGDTLTECTQAADEAVGIAAQPTAGGSDAWFPYFTGGVFNHQAIIWPADADTLEKRKAMFDGSNIVISHLF